MTRLALFAALLLTPATAAAGRADVGGYFRVMARPDLQGGNGRLGFWNLYGRLMNEGSYGMLELRYDVLEPRPGSKEPWTALHARLEGGSIANADPGNGSLANFRMSQVFVKTGNVLLDDVTWQVGTLESFFGDLGLYDMRPATIFFDTVGVSGRYESDRVELLLGVGDSGYKKLGSAYNAILTPGGTVRLRLANGHFEIGGGGEVFIEASTKGNINAPYHTPRVDYEDYVRGEVAQSYLDEFPGLEAYFPDPRPRDATSYNVVGYVGFGGGPLLWNNFFLSYKKQHPERFVTEQLGSFGQIPIYIHDFTDQRTVLTLGNEMQLRIVPRKFDIVLGGLYGNHTDKDNDIVPSDHDRWYASGVLRGQTYLTETFHVLVETSIAQEVSKNGNTYREHPDSVFANTGGVPDVRGLETGDTDTRTTWQGKGGFVLNPLGTGIYTRPSLRILYGVQHSNVNNAFGNAFVISLDQFEDFQTVEQHLHHLLAFEAEVWF